jgi:glycosyltransferase involved in cell wall biosynthesis
MLQGHSIICFAGEDWWYHHPHSKNHLMLRFSRGQNEVIFVNSISMGLAPLSNRDLLPRVARKLRSYAKVARRVDEHLTVVSPFSLPFFGSRATRGVNHFLLSMQIRLLARHRGLKNPILWIAIPTAADMIGRLNESLVVYQVSDKYEANVRNNSTDPAVIRRLHEQALDRADVIFYSGRKLFNEAAHARERSHFLEQAVDFEHWRKVGTGKLNVPPQIASIPRPRLGYFGAIDPWLIDQDLIRVAAREQPNWHWVFIGNRMRPLEIEQLENVHVLPPVPYQELPRWAAGFDVCVLPWEAGLEHTSYGSAIKVREYLATGKPVVISPLPEYESMRDVLRIGRTHDQFLEAVREALAEDGAREGRARQASVAAGTWDARAEWVSTVIEHALAERNGRSREGDGSPAL